MYVCDDRIYGIIWLYTVLYLYYLLMRTAEFGLRIADGLLFEDLVV